MTIGKRHMAIHAISFTEMWKSEVLYHLEHCMHVDWFFIIFKIILMSTEMSSCPHELCCDHKWSWHAMKHVNMHEVLTTIPLYPSKGKRHVDNNHTIVLRSQHKEETWPLCPQVLCYVHVANVTDLTDTDACTNNLLYKQRLTLYIHVHGRTFTCGSTSDNN